MPAKGYLDSRDLKTRAVQPYHLGLRVENAFAGTLTAGTLVYVSGINTTSTDPAVFGMLKVTKADADAPYPASVATFVVVEDIAQSGFGNVARAALVRNVDTSGYGIAGDSVYLSATAGASAVTAPTSALANTQRVGRVLVKDASVGSISYDLESFGVERFGTLMGPLTGVQYATGSLTNAQILALATTSVSLVAAQGAGTVIELISGALFFDYTGAYTEPSAPDDLVIRYTGNAGTIVSQDGDATNFLTATADAALFLAPLAGAITTVRLKTACDNQPLVIHNTGGDYGGGNAANVVRYAIAYRVHSAGW